MGVDGGIGERYPEVVREDQAGMVSICRSKLGRVTLQLA